MSRVTKISAWLALWFFIASALAILPAAIEAAQAGNLQGNTRTVQYDFESEIPALGGALDIRIQSEIEGSPPGDLLLIGPTGFRIGPTLGDLYLRDPVSGPYRLQVTGFQPGVYTLYLTAYGKRGSTSDVSFPHVTINPGEIHYYLINFSTQGEVSIKARRIR